MSSQLFSEIAADSLKRETFVNSTITFIDTYGFEGIEIDWEWPGSRYDPPNPNDRSNHVLLMKELYEALNPLGYIVSTVILPWPGKLEDSFDIPGFSPYVDMINIMSYDFHGYWPTMGERLYFFI